jgi:hypothetical protein
MDPIFGFIIVVSALINFDNANTLKAENAVLEEKVETLKYATEELYTRHESVAEYVDEQSIEHEEDFIRLAASHAAATARRKHDIDENASDIEQIDFAVELLELEVEYLMEMLKTQQQSQPEPIDK